MSYKFIDPDSSAFDPGILPVYTCVKRLYMLCSEYTTFKGCIQWSFIPGKFDATLFQEVLKSFQFFEVNYFYHVDAELFEGNSRMFIEAQQSHLWGKMFDCLRTDCFCEKISPSRRPKRPSSSQY